MQTIPIETIVKHWRTFQDEFDESTVYKRLKRLHEWQPLMMRYLQVAEKNSIKDEARQVMYYFGSFIAYAMLNECQHSREVTTDEWEKARTINERMTEFLGTERNAGDFHRSFSEIVETHNQPGLLVFAVESVWNDRELGERIPDEELGRVVIHLKIVIDCLDKVTTSK
jgi:hypothetical protein